MVPLVAHRHLTFNVASRRLRGFERFFANLLFTAFTPEAGEYSDRGNNQPASQGHFREPSHMFWSGRPHLSGQVLAGAIALEWPSTKTNDAWLAHAAVTVPLTPSGH